MSRPTVSQLHESGRFCLVESFSIDEMMYFVLRELGMKPPQPSSSLQLTWQSALVFLLLAALGGVVGFVFGKMAYQNGIEVPDLTQFLLVIPGLLLILVVHEGIHALVFRALGAPKVGFGYSKKGLVVYAYADRFVMRLRENALVAVMPFLVITAALVAGLVLVPQYGLALVLALLLHTFGCMGDFALIRHWWKTRRRAMYTYDDLTEKRSYFFEESPEPLAQSSRPLGTEVTGR